ncbi:MAG: hypothetical protein AB8D78_10695 [Akkermansiaceae bacterium]
MAVPAVRFLPAHTPTKGRDGCPQPSASNSPRAPNLPSPNLPAHTPPKGRDGWDSHPCLLHIQIIQRTPTRPLRII